MAAGEWIVLTVVWVLVILDRRFVRGELASDTYRKMREELRGRDGVRR